VVTKLRRVRSAQHGQLHAELPDSERSAVGSKQQSTTRNPTDE
jgi:hypothetical protein